MPREQSLAPMAALPLSMASDEANSVKDWIRLYLEDLPADEQFTLVLDIMALGQERQEQGIEFVAEAWDYLQAHALWKADPWRRYQSQGQIRARLNEEIHLDETLRAHRTSRQRRLREERRIEANWKAPLQKVLPNGLLPADASQNLVKALARLSSSVGVQEAVPLLQQAIHRRRQQPGSRTTNQVTLADVTEARELYASNSGSIVPATDPSSVTGDDEDADESALSSRPATSSTEKGSVLSATQTTQVSTTAPSRQAPRRPATPHPAPPRSCTCPENFTQAFSLRRQMQPASDATAWSLMALAQTASLAKICHQHQRSLCAAFGLRNNLKGSVLTDRLHTVRDFQGGDLLALRTRHRSWFRQSHRPLVPQDELVIYRFPPRPSEPFQFNPETVMNRFAGPGAWQTWQEKGTLTLDRFFAHLDSPKVRVRTEGEFGMYRHHQWVPSGKRRMGWMRHMFYSGIQQIGRMDLGWYGLVVAARPDLQWRLITYPYVTKDTDPGESTGFLHLDLNVARFLEDGSGGSMLSSSIALDDETADGCTVVVPGFHHHIRDWYACARTRDKRRVGATTNCNAIYRKEDEGRWGAPAPQPCGAFGLRVTLPTLIHGSTPWSDRRRRSLFAWHTAIGDDHETLTDTGAMSWSQLAACHRDMRIPAREPSGGAPLHRVPDWVFPGGLVLDRVSPLAGALVGARRWTDPAVLQERDILLGPDDERARELTDRVRRMLIEAYIRQWDSLVMAESQAFVPDSYFSGNRRDGNGSEVEDEDGADDENGESDCSMELIHPVDGAPDGFEANGDNGDSESVEMTD